MIDPYTEHMAAQAGLINIERLQKWLAAYGIAAPSSQEEMAATVGQQINKLLRQEPFPARQNKEVFADRTQDSSAQAPTNPPEPPPRLTFDEWFDTKIKPKIETSFVFLTRETMREAWMQCEKSLPSSPNAPRSLSPLKSSE